MGFLTQWKIYLDQLPAGLDARAYRGKKLDPTIFEKVSVAALVVAINVESRSSTLDVTRAARAVVRSDARYQRRLEACRTHGGGGTRDTEPRIGETIDFV